MANEEAEAEACHGATQACPDEVSSQLIDECAGTFNDDDATVATAQYSLSGNASNENLAAWAMDKISSIQPMDKLLLNRESRSSLFSEDQDDEDEGNNEFSSSEASLSSMKGLDNISVGSDVILPFRYSYRTSLRGARSQSQELGYSEDPSSTGHEKVHVDQLDMTSDTTSSSTPSSQSNGSSCESESVYEADDDGADDVDSDMTLGEAASQVIDYSNESDDDLDSKASSSRFTPDEFWDWLDNVQVAFIEVGNNKLPRRPKTRGTSSGARKVSEEPSFSGSFQLTEDVGMRGQSFGESPIRVSVNQRDYLRDEGHNKKEAYRGNVDDRFVPSHVPLFKRSASVADFRSRSEHDQQEHCNIRRTVSFADIADEDSSCVDERSDECDARVRRISSNEDLLLTLHRRIVPSRLPKNAASNAVNAVASMAVSERTTEVRSASLVCYEPRLRVTSRLLVLFSAFFALAFTTLHHANLFYEDLPGTCKPRAVTIDLDKPFIPSLEEVRGSFESSTSAAVDAFRHLKHKLPESLDEVNKLLEESKLSAFELYSQLKEHLAVSAPDLKLVDVPNYAADAYQEAVEVMKVSRTVLAGALLSRSEREGDQQWTESVDRLQTTLVRARASLLKRLTELCRSSAIEGPKNAVFGACDALYESLATTYRTPDVSAEPGPPQLIVDRQFIRRSFDAMANETLSYIGRFATVIHGLCSEVQGHCQSNMSTAFPHDNDHGSNVQHMKNVSEGSYLTSGTVDSSIASQASHSATKQTEEDPFVPYESVSERARESARESHDASGSTITPLVLGEHSSFQGGTIDRKAEAAVSQRVRDILSHLDAGGRLHELENLLVEKFGPDFVEPPPSTVSFDAGYVGLVPLLGRERDRQLRERLLSNLENEVVEAAMRGQSKFDWATHVKGRVQSIVDFVASREKGRKDRKADE